MKPKGREERGSGQWTTTLLVSLLPSQAAATHTEALLPQKWLDITCWWEVENNFFFFFCFISTHSLCFFFFFIIKWPFSEPTGSFILLSLPVPLRQESESATWWAPGSQPSSTHHSPVWCPKWMPNSKETSVTIGHSFMQSGHEMYADWLFRKAWLYNPCIFTTILLFAHSWLDISLLFSNSSKSSSALSRKDSGTNCLLRKKQKVIQISNTVLCWKVTAKHLCGALCRTCPAYCTPDFRSCSLSDLKPALGSPLADPPATLSGMLCPSASSGHCVSAFTLGVDAGRSFGVTLGKPVHFSYELWLQRITTQFRFACFVVFGVFSN